MRKSQKIIIGLLSLFILLFGVGFNLYLLQNLQNQDIDIGQPLVEYQTGSADLGNLQNLIHEAQKSIVQINVETNYTDRVGSGFLYNSRGDIVTNAHVISDAISIEVTMSNAETYPAAIVGIGETKDIAVIRVPQLINYQPIELETSQHYLPGSEIIAVGSPLGFHNTVTTGIISGVDRSFEINGYSYDNVYQISANITHGNSGGPLINAETGKVIGINSAGIEESEIGFSIPIPAIIDDITEWSTTISNDQLIFPSRGKAELTDDDLILEEVNYLLNYFIDSLKINDYINAYTLLGSELQNELDYPSFRSEYVHLKNISLIELDELELSQAEITLLATIEYDDTTDQSGLTQSNFQFTLGYENDQLKVLNIYFE